MNRAGFGECFGLILRFVPSNFREFLRDFDCYGRVLRSGLISLVCGFMDNGTGGAFLLGNAY